MKKHYSEWQSAVGGTKSFFVPFRQDIAETPALYARIHHFMVENYISMLSKHSSI
jgi:hypothetical protein